MATTPTNGALGIDNLKRVLAFILLTVNMIMELVKNFNYAKALSLAFHIGENLAILDVGKQALAELRDLSVEESQQIADYLGNTFDLANDNLEARIEEGIDLIPEGYGLLKLNISYFQKLSGFVASWKAPAPGVIPELEKSLRKLDLPTVRKTITRAA